MRSQGLGRVAVVAAVSACAAHGGLIDNPHMRGFLSVNDYVVAAQVAAEGDIQFFNDDTGYATTFWNISDDLIESTGYTGSTDPDSWAQSGFYGTFELTEPAAYRFFGRLEGLANRGGAAEAELSRAGGEPIHRLKIESGTTTFDYSGVLPAGRYDLDLHAIAWTVNTFGEPSYDVTFVVPEPGAGLGVLLGAVVVVGRGRRG